MTRFSGKKKKEGSLFQYLPESMTNSACGGTDLELCRDDSAAFVLKFVAMASILLAGMTGIAIPLIGKHRRFIRTDGSLFVAAKAFAAGVILATGFVHMLSDATDALTDPCLPKYPWSKFPFTGFFAMTSALLTLLVDFVGTQYYERKQGMTRASQEQGPVGSSDSGMESGIVPVVEVKDLNGKVFGEEESGGMHIVGMHAHAAHHRHSHPHGHDSCHTGLSVKGPSHDHHPHSHGFDDDEGGGGVRHVVVSQVLLLSFFFVSSYGSWLLSSKSS